MLGYDLWGAITAVKFDGYSHEYQVVKWVKETILDINLNLKTLRFRIDEEMEATHRVRQKFSWVGKYTSKDIKLPTGIVWLDEDVYLFEITDPNVTIECDIRIEKWYGYYSMEFLKDREEQKDEQDEGLILIDNDFRLVRKVLYEVEEVIDDFKWWLKDKLSLTVQSKYKKFTPKEFIAFAWEVLASYAKLFIFDNAYIDKSVLVDYERLEKESSIQEEENIKTMPIDALPLSERTRNALIKNEILYVEELEKKKKGELLLMKWVGRKAIEEVTSALEWVNKTLAG